MLFIPLPRIATTLVLVLTVVFTAATAFAQSFQTSMDCEIKHRRCEQRAHDQTPGDDPCSAYSRCQSKQMCEASRCVCQRTHGSGDPALAAEAMAMCNLLISPHGTNRCDSYAKACQDWYDSQHQQPQAPSHPQPPTPGGGGQPIPPDQLPRFR